MGPGAGGTALDAAGIVAATVELDLLQGGLASGGEPSASFSPR